MFALLLKRKRNAKKVALQSQSQSQPTAELTDVSGKAMPDTSPNKTANSKPRVMLEDKPWDEVQHALKMDLEYARTLAGSQEKVPFKQTLIDKYQVVVARLVATREDLAGLDIVWWYYQWKIDCGLLSEVHDEFKALVLKGLNTPQGWSSNGQTAYCDIIFKYSNACHKAEVAFNADYLMALSKDLVTGSLATNAAVKVKVFKLAGDLLLNAGHTADALNHFKLVMAIDPNGGGRKKKIKELEESLNNE